MKILSAAEMRDVDRLTIERGIPGIILMENAGQCVVRYLEVCFAPLRKHRVAVFCGKGNNGGDGYVVARQLFQRRLCAELFVIEIGGAEDLTGDAATARTMLLASGCKPTSELSERVLSATIVVDALLGTGLRGAARPPALEYIRAINTRFPHAVKVSVDYPSGFPTDELVAGGEYVRTGHTVTFTALKRSQALSPSYEAMGNLHVSPIGTPENACETNDRYRIRLTTVNDIASLFAPRPKNSNKGLYGHVLVVAGSAPKPGAAAMAGLAVLRSGAGLSTVASASGAIASISAISPELMTEPLPQTESGHISGSAREAIEEVLKNKSVLAIGPGLGTEPETVALVRHLYATAGVPMVIDADGLNAMAGSDLKTDKIRVLTPHPGEMSRLMGKSTTEIQSSRLESAQLLAETSGATVVLKGDRTVIAFPDGDVWINPTGSPSMSTGGTGDVLTGMVAGLLAQQNRVHIASGEWKLAIVAAVWLHGRCGELGAGDLGEQPFIATDIFRYLPAAIKECREALFE